MMILNYRLKWTDEHGTRQRSELMDLLYAKRVKVLLSRRTDYKDIEIVYDNDNDDEGRA